MAPGEEQGNGGNSVISKKLDGHPVLKYLGTAAASIVAMGVAGGVVRKGGMRAVFELQAAAFKNENLAGRVDGAVKSFRKVEAYLDELQGVTRAFNPDETGRDILFGRAPGGRRLTRTDNVIQTDGFNYRVDNPDRGEWAIRDEIQQRMVRQARRLPYEVPGFYAAEKLILDPVMGTGEDKKVNWNNPVDVVGDFASSSIKNIALNVLPFEGAAGAAKQSYRNVAMKIARNPGNSLGVQSTGFLLEQVGASATDLISQSLRFGHQSIGAFSGLINESIENSRTITQVTRQASSQPTHARTKPIGNSYSARRAWERAKDAVTDKDLRRSALDALPGPFKGMSSAIRNVRGNWNATGQTYDDWQAVISGRLPIESLGTSTKRYSDLVAFMQKGGGTYIEKFARDTNNLVGLPSVNPDGSVSPGVKGSNFYGIRKDQVYKQTLVESLVERAGLRHEDAIKFVNKSERIAPFSASKSSDTVGFGKGLIERIQFGKDPYLGEPNGWWNDLVKRANAHDIPLGKAVGPKGKILDQDTFSSAVGLADMRFSAKDFARQMDSSITSQWNHLYGNVIPAQATSGMKGMARPYEEFRGGALEANKDWMVRRAAQRLNISGTDAAGTPKSIVGLQNELRQKGLEPTNLHSLRGYLRDQRDIAAPWTTNGRNLFGFKPLSVGQALQNGYFSANEAGTQQHIKHFVDYRTSAAVNSQRGLNKTSAFQLRAGGAFTHSDGTVIDLGRIGRGFRSFYDTIASETQIPVLNFNPLQILGSNAFQTQRRSPSIKVINSLSSQPLVNPGGQTNNTDFMLWMRSRARSNKGNLFNVRGDSSQQLQGTYSAWMTNSQTMLGRYGHIFAGESGVPSSRRASAVDGNNWRSKARRYLDVSYDQEGSVFFGQQSLRRRYMQGRKRSPERFRNPNVMAGRLAESAELGTFGAREAEGMEGIVSMLRNYGFSANTLKSISEDDAYKSIFAPLGQQSLFEIPETALPRIAQKVLSDDSRLFSGLTSDSKKSEARKLQQQLRNILKQGSGQDDFWTLPTSEQARSVGVSRRIDQLRNELSGYLIATSGVRGEALTGAASRGVDDTIQSLYSKIDDIHRGGAISGAERSEARAAILGLQVDQMRNRAYSQVREQYGDVNLQELNRLTAQALISGSTETRAVLQELADFRPGTGNSFFKDLFGRAVKRNTTTTPYRTPFGVNPIGDDYLLVPNFGTVANREGGGLLRGMKGATSSWSDPNSVSSMSVPATHAAMRLNRYLESFGAGLDPTRYKGPLDFYARGLIGKRVAPLYVAGATALAVDRTAGGMVHRDENGDPVYSPLLLGAGADVVAAGQVGLAGITPGGQTAAEKREELTEGEVPIRQGRYWLLGNQPFKGGRIQYFRPSWYQRFKSGASFAPEMNETPMERLAFGYDFSPLRPLDPYRREREDAQSRPYPMSGDYFTGPWGALNPILNSTIGRVLKPQRQLNAGANEQMLSQYAPVGEQGAYLAGGSNVSPSALIAGADLSSINQGYMAAGPGSSSMTPFYGGLGYAAPRGAASQEVRGRATSIASMYSAKASDPSAYVTVNDMLTPYGVPVASGYMSPRVIPTGQPIQGGMGMRARDLGYRTQETLGIYGFAGGSIRSALGMGSQDFAPDRAVLEPSSRGYSSSRAFWNLNLGGTGDLPLPLESKYSNFEVSEIVRRFVPKDPQGVTFINDLPNLMGQKYPWLPGGDYPLASVKTGDPYTSVPDAEIRLPGTGYARTNMLFPDANGRIGMANIHDILGSIAPWSKEYDRIDSLVNSSPMSELANAKVNQTRAQVEAMRIKNEFTPYEYKYSSPLEMAKNPMEYGVGRGWEWLAHRDTFFNTKFLPERTALEDWERNNVYGATFPSWQSPYESYIQPFLNKSTQRNPIAGLLGGAGLGMLFGKTGRARAVGALAGGIIGGSASVYGKGYEAITGDRYMPAERRKEIALEEYADILKYTKSVVNASRATQMGNTELAAQFVEESKKTMYGADLNSTPERVLAGVPDRKREHLNAMMYAPPQERKQILSTAGRLERRILQAAWGMQVEARPDLPEYFQDHELPDAESPFWNPLTDTDQVKIKIGQHMGLDMAQMGYYPQQIQEANLVNPSYPNMFQSSSGKSVMARLRELMTMQGARGTVSSYPNALGENRLELTAGVY